MKDKLIAALGIVSILGIMVLAISWSNHRDRLVIEAAAKYEECVKVEYNTTPSAWYAEHGEYPECSIR